MKEIEKLLKEPNTSLVNIEFKGYDMELSKVFTSLELNNPIPSSENQRQTWYNWCLSFRNNNTPDDIEDDKYNNPLGAEVKRFLESDNFDMTLSKTLSEKLEIARAVLTYVAIWYSKQLQNEPNSTTSSLTTKETNNSIPSNKDDSTFRGRLDQEVETLECAISILGSIANPAGASALFRKVRDSGMSWYASQTEELERRKLLAAAYVMVDEKKKCVNSLIDQVNSKHKEKGTQKTDKFLNEKEVDVLNAMMKGAGDPLFGY
jgi:hypothetical protein